MIAHVAGIWLYAAQPPAEKTGLETDDAGYVIDWDAMRRAAQDSRTALLRRAAQLSVPGTHLGPQTLETFTVTAENRAAFELAQSAVEGEFSGWIHGPIGVGKSHLAKAVLKAARGRGLPAILTTIETILARIRDTYDADGDRMEWWVKACYADVPVLILDDVGKERLTDWGASAIFDIVNQRAEAHLSSPRPVFVTSNQPFAETAAIFAKRFPENPTLGIGIIDRLRQLAGGDDRIVAVSGSSRRGAA